MSSPAGLIFAVIEHGSEAYLRAVELREEILRRPLGLAFSADEITGGLDHLQIAGFRDGILCATCAMVPKEDGRLKMQRVAISQGEQSRGVGSALLVFCEEVARARGCPEIYCHARATAVNFYLKAGYVLEGGEFIEATIPHRLMRKRLV